MQAVNCPNCGAALPVRAAKSNVVTCEFCSTTFRVPSSLTPEPDMGDLLLGVDFSRKPMPGWGCSFAAVRSDRLKRSTGFSPLDAKCGLKSALRESFG
jgi:hypothetical protein